MKKFMHNFIVKQNLMLSEQYFVLTLKCPELLPEILPGQFVELKVESSPTTFLRRPFSIYDVDFDENSIKLLVKIVGPGTQSLSTLNINENVNLIYPLGNSFTLVKKKTVLLVGGGVGIAPMLFLAKHLFANECSVDVLIGGRTKDDIIAPTSFEAYASVYISTDDGSNGEKGLVTDHSLIIKNLKKYSGIYACGPDPMMRAIAHLANASGISCEISLENLMACGIGACLCCVVETNDGNKTTCLDGPIFDYTELKGWY